MVGRPRGPVRTTGRGRDRVHAGSRAGRWTSRTLGCVHAGAPRPPRNHHDSECSRPVDVRSGPLLGTSRKAATGDGRDGPSSLSCTLLPSRPGDLGGSEPTPGRPGIEDRSEGRIRAGGFTVPGRPPLELVGRPGPQTAGGTGRAGPRNGLRAAPSRSPVPLRGGRARLPRSRENRGPCFGTVRRPARRRRVLLVPVVGELVRAGTGGPCRGEGPGPGRGTHAHGRPVEYRCDGPTAAAARNRLVDSAGRACPLEPAEQRPTGAPRARAGSFPAMRELPERARRIGDPEPVHRLPSPPVLGVRGHRPSDQRRDLVPSLRLGEPSRRAIP